MTNKKIKELVKLFEAGDLKSLEELLENGTDVNLQDEKGRTLIFHAIERNDANAVEMLLKHQADFTIKDFNGFLPTDSMDNEKMEFGYVNLNRKREYKKIEKLLLSPYPRDITFMNKELLFSAVIEGSLTLLKDAITSGGVTDVNIRLKDGTTPLHLASQKGHAKIVKELLEIEANYPIEKRDRIPLFVDSIDNKGKTALHYAVESKSKKIIQLLIQFQASTAIKDSNGQTAANLLDNQEPIEDRESIDRKKIDQKTKIKSAPLDVFENKLFDRIVNALKDEFKYGKLNIEKFENLIVYCEESYAGGFYINNTPLLAASEVEIEELVGIDALKMYSNSGDNSFADKIYDESEIEELNKIVHALGIKIADDLDPISYLMHRVCARLEKMKSHSDLPLGDNFVAFIDEMGTVNFNLRNTARETLNLNSTEFLLKTTTDTK